MPNSPIVLDRQSVLDGANQSWASAQSDAFTLARLPDATRLSLRLAVDDAERLSPIAGFEIHQSINSVTGTDRLAMRLGPDEWLLLGEDARPIGKDLSTVLTDAHHSLVDVSHRQIAFAVRGERAADVLNCGCPLDLHESAFPPGSATRTLLGKAEVVLSRPVSEPVWRIECWRSFGRYVSDYLSDAARLLGITPSI